MAVQSPTFRSQELALRDGQLEYRVAGEGRPILYLHSARGVRVSPALESLAASFCIYVPTLPGFDGTPTLAGVHSMRDLAELADEFSAAAIGERCDVIGHSFGGRVAAWLAVLHPERVGQLVLEAPAGFRTEGVGALAGTPEDLRRWMFVHPERVGDEKPAELEARNRPWRSTTTVPRRLTRS